VLLLDEPTKEIDMKGKRVVWEAIRRKARAGMSVLLCSHDVMEVRDLCDRVFVLHEGKLTATIERRELEGADLLRIEELLVARMEGR
jgi:ABC-type multidrug transport system ATPase subunit